MFLVSSRWWLLLAFLGLWPHQFLPLCVCVCVCVCNLPLPLSYMSVCNQGLPRQSRTISFQEISFNYICRSDQIRSVAQLCPTLCDLMNCSTSGFHVHHQLPEFTQTHVHRVSDAIQPSHPLSSPSPLAPNPSQHQSLFQWVNSSHEVAKVLEFQI